MQCRLSGFPPRGEIAKNNLRRINHVLRWWTFGRITWGIFTLILLKENWLCTSSNITVNTLTTICLFAITELVPFSVSLDPNLLAMIADDEKVRSIDPKLFRSSLIPNEEVRDEENSLYSANRYSSYVNEEKATDNINSIEGTFGANQNAFNYSRKSVSNLSESSGSLREDDASLVSES